MSERSILILDDHAQTGRALERYFRSQGYVAEAFARVADARARLASHVPSLMIIDEMMPEMTGLQLVEQLRADERTRRVPIVIYSAIADDVLTRRARPLKVSACWRKGAIDLPRMREQVDRILAEAGSAHCPPISA